MKKAEDAGADAAALKTLLGKGRSKTGMFEGNLTDGELEIGQVSALIKSIQPAAAVVAEIWEEFQATRKRLWAEG